MIAFNMTSFLNKLKTLYGIIAVLFSFSCYGQSDQEVQQVNQYLNAKDDYRYDVIPHFYTKDSTHGFQYFSHRWLRGVVIYSDNRMMANSDTLHIDNSRYYNFDKYNNKLVSSQNGKNVLYLPNDAISKFILVDSERVYIFKKVPEISKSQYLQPMVENENGYSLYKHTITKYKRADYQNIGYGETGKKYDEYVDSYEYYILFPGRKDFKKLSLNTASVKKIFKDNSATVDEFFQQNQGEINEEMLYNLILFLNNKAGY